MSPIDTESFSCETERLLFRGLCKSDIDGPYFHWMNDQEVCRYNSHGIFPVTSEKLNAYIEMLQTTESHLVWAIIEKEGGEHIGNISLQVINRIYQSAEFAIMIGDKTCWGKGYGKEAARALISHGFKKLGLRRISCGTSENNSGMIQLAKVLGMKKEGVRRRALFENGEFADKIEFGLLKNEFDQANV